MGETIGERLPAALERMTHYLGGDSAAKLPRIVREDLMAIVATAKECSALRARPSPEPAASKLHLVRFTIQKCGRDEHHEWIALGEEGGKCPICLDATACDYRGPFVAYVRPADLMPPPGADVRTRPRVVCLCGSTRFMDAFFDEGWRLTLAGEIVLSVGVCKHAEHHGAEALGHDVADRLDELHLRKIDMADYVRVLNVGGYIGSSTRKEIEYAKATGKLVEYLEPHCG